MVNQMILAAGELHHGQVPLGEAIAFWILGPIALAGAMGTVLLRNAVHSALSLVATMMSLGAFYLIEQGPFLGLVQIIVYTGAIMILFLFVLMLVGRDASDSLIETLRGQRIAAAFFGIAFALLVAVSVGRAFKGAGPAVNLNGASSSGVDPAMRPRCSTRTATTSPASRPCSSPSTCSPSSSPPRCSSSPPSERWCWPTSSATSRSRPSGPWPAPASDPDGPSRCPAGCVLSSHDAIGTPALLPDGSIAVESIMASVPGGVDDLDVPALPAGEQGEEQ